MRSGLACARQQPTRIFLLCAPLQRWFYCSSTLRCGAIFEMFCARLGISLGAVKFMLRGERVFGASTPASLKVGGALELCTTHLGVR
jgi:hypothetical protein